MPRWSQAPVLYKIGIIGILFSFVVFVVGFGTPVWHQFDAPVGKVGYGLWQYCDEILSDCPYYLESHKVIVVRCVEIAACAFHLSSIINVFVTLMCPQNRPATIVVSGIIAGVIGLVGQIVFATWGIVDFPYPGWSLSWSFGLAVAGSGLVIIFSILLAISSRYISYPEKKMVNSSDQYMQEFPDSQPSPKQTHYDEQRSHLYNEENRVMPDLPRYQPAPRSQYQQPHQPAQYHYHGGKQYGHEQKY